MIRVVITDDQEIVCEGLRTVLNASPHIEVVGLAYNGAQALDLVRALKPDLVLMDLKMPVMNGIHATRAIVEQFPDLAVLVLTTYDDDAWVIDAIRAGARGYLLKDTGRDQLVAAVEGTIAGRTHVDSAVAEKLFGFVRHGTQPRSTIADRFSERERAVLRLLASGLTNAAIADRLHLAEGTVRNHVTSILAKLDVTDRAQATALAWRYGLVVPEGPG
ncbi:MAG: response regulator transcription factor [Roseiflexaceae bacterium]|nr:response regulator transcription factor [Roseiflexaceae bacterium]